MLTADMKRVIGGQHLGFVATVNADGTPNVSPGHLRRARRFHDRLRGHKVAGYTSKTQNQTLRLK